MTDTTMIRKIIVIGALAAVSLLALHAQAQVQVIEFAIIPSPHPAPEPSEEEAGEKYCHAAFDSILPWRSSKLQECLRAVHEEAAKKAAEDARQHPVQLYMPDPAKQFLPDHGTCQHLLDKDDYVNYEACMRFYTGLPH
ncbi:MAG: hypothetical protein ACLPX9_03080 [Rhodomicrobium sp.]